MDPLNNNTPVDGVDVQAPVEGQTEGQQAPEAPVVEEAPVAPEQAPENPVA
jgi:hypothetical protein